MLACLFWIGAPAGSSAQSNPTNIWVLKLMQYALAVSSPAIAPDGTIYQATFTGKLLAVTPRGTVKWISRRAAKSSLRRPSGMMGPFISVRGTGNSTLFHRKANSNGPFQPARGWIRRRPSAPTARFISSWDTNFYALHPDGSLKWIFPTGSIIDSSPAIGTDGTIYFGSHDKKFYALKPDGTLRWTFTTGGQIISSPAITADGTIYFTSTDGNFYALRPDGTERWRLHTGGATESSPVLDPAGNIYLLVNQDIISISREGRNRWKLSAVLRLMRRRPSRPTVRFIFPRRGGT